MEEDDLILSRLKLTELFLTMARGVIQPEEEGYLPREQERLIRHLRDHIISDELNYSSLEELAEEHGISVSFLQKSFKQIYGMPVYQYLKSYRLEKAAADAEKLCSEAEDMLSEFSSRDSFLSWLIAYMTKRVK